MATDLYKKEFGADVQRLLATLETDKKPGRMESAAFLQDEVGSNDERGYEMYCHACRRWTKHLAHSNGVWAARRCMRRGCGEITVQQIIAPPEDDIDKPLAISPDMTLKALFLQMVTVYGWAFATRAFEWWKRRLGEERALDEALARLKAEKLVLQLETL